MIEVLNLKKTFGKREVLKGINLEIKRGVITGLAGPNACGKTTLIKCILGLVVPDFGTIKIDGQIVDIEGAFRKKIGYIPQNPNFPNNLNLNELMSMLEDLRHERATRKEELAVHFSLEKMQNQPFGELSGGSKQKIAIATALMFDAEILICDEPTAGLDPVSSVHFKELLMRQAEKGKAVVFVSHQLTEIEQLASNVIFMNDGIVLFSGSADELRTKTRTPNLENAITALYSDILADAQ